MWLAYIRYVHRVDRGTKPTCKHGPHLVTSGMQCTQSPPKTHAISSFLKQKASIQFITTAVLIMMRQSFTTNSTSCLFSLFNKQQFQYAPKGLERRTI